MGRSGERRRRARAGFGGAVVQELEDRRLLSASGLSGGLPTAGAGVSARPANVVAGHLVIEPELLVTTSTKRGPRGLTSGGALGFGTVGMAAAPTPAQRVLTIHNVGNTDLTLGGLSVPSGFTVLDGLDVSQLAPGQTETLTIGLGAALAPGTYGGPLSFTSNDADESPFQVTLSGTVLAPVPPPNQPAVLRVSAFGSLGRSFGVTNGEVTSWGAQAVGSGLVARTFRFSNPSAQEIDFGRLSLPAGYVILDPLLRKLSGGQSDDLVIGLDTSTAGTKGGTMSFAIVGDRGSQMFQLELTGLVR